MRLFIGIRIPEDIKENIHGITQKLSKKIKEARLVPPENLHITLKFLGEVEDNRLKAIGDNLVSICRQVVPFDIFFKGTGVFPEGKQIRVFWIGVSSGGILKNLNIKIEKELETLGFLRDNRFQEHLTVARFKSIPIRSFVSELMESYKESFFGSMYAEHVEIIQSILTSGSPVYETLLKIPFVR